MPYGPSTAMQTRMAQRYAAEVASFSLHSADTAGTGAGEIPGAGRKAAVWTVTGTQANAAMVTFPVPVNTQVTAVGMWASDGTFLDSVAYSAFFSVAGNADITVHYTYQQAVAT